MRTVQQRTLGGICAAAMTATMLVAAPAAQGETLSDAMIAAYRNSHLLEQNRAVLRAADEDVAVAVAALRPVISFAASAHNVYPGSLYTSGGTKNYATVGLQATMTLFSFGRNRMLVDAKKQAVLATREALVGVEQNVLLGAVKAFLDVRNAQEVVVLNEGNVRVLEQQLKAAKDRFEVGEVTRTDVAQAEAALAAARSQLTAARGKLNVAREAYKAATGHYPGKLTRPPKAPSIPKTLEAAVAIAQHQHPSILGAQYQVKAADIGIRVAKRATMPTITADAQAGHTSYGYNNNSVSLSVQAPIYAGGKYTAMYRQVVAQADQARAGLLQASVDVTQGVGNAWAQLQVARASIGANDEQIRAAQTAYNGVKEEAKLGSRTTLDVLNADQALLNARSERITAGTNEYLAVYSLLSSMGLLTVQHLKLGVPTYDAQAYYNAVKGAPTSVRGKRLDDLLKSLGKN